MQKLYWIAVLVLASSPASALDFSDFDAVCVETANAASPANPEEFHQICTCAYDVIAEDLGQDLTVIYARFELADETLDNMLPDDMSSEAFFERIGGIGPEIDAACAP